MLSDEMNELFDMILNLYFKSKFYSESLLKLDIISLWAPSWLPYMSLLAWVHNSVEYMQFGKMMWMLQLKLMVSL